MLEDRLCSRCGATARQVAIGPIVSEPRGWTCVTVGGLPVCNRRVCPSCAADVRKFLAVAPDEVERRTEQMRETVFTRGYDEGVAEAAMTRDPMESGVS